MTYNVFGGTLNFALSIHISSGKLQLLLQIQWVSWYVRTSSGVRITETLQQLMAIVLVQCTCSRYSSSDSEQVVPSQIAWNYFTLQLVSYGRQVLVYWWSWRHRTKPQTVHSPLQQQLHGIGFHRKSEQLPPLNSFPVL